MAEPNEIADAIRKVLNAHGHGFHYAVMRRGEQLFEEKRSRWHVIGAEYPVQVGSTTTHIDFVYSRQHAPSRTTYLIAECKRVNPKLGRWCFATAPYTWFDADSKELVFDQLRSLATRSYGIPNIPLRAQSDRSICHIGKELKTNQHGDDTGSGRAIDEAVAQVLRGTSGFLNLVRGDGVRCFEGPVYHRFIPVIFTTAELWVTDADLGSADLRNGELGSGIRARKEDWIWFVHNRSPAIAPNRPSESNGSSDLSALLRQQFARAIAIVSPTGVDDFLSRDLGQWLSEYDS
jgi:hypothetical protein